MERSRWWPISSSINIFKDKCEVHASPVHTTWFSVIENSNFLNLVDGDSWMGHSDLAWLGLKYPSLNGLCSLYLCFYIQFLYVPFCLVQLWEWYSFHNVIQTSLLFLINQSFSCSSCLQLNHFKHEVGISHSMAVTYGEVQREWNESCSWPYLIHGLMSTMCTLQRDELCRNVPESGGVTQSGRKATFRQRPAAGPSRKELCLGAMCPVFWKWTWVRTGMMLGPQQPVSILILEAP